MALDNTAVSGRPLIGWRSWLPLTPTLSPSPSGSLWRGCPLWVARERRGEGAPASPAQRALRVDVERVERLARGHEQAVARARPPKQRLAQRSGSAMRPIGVPSGLNTATPSKACRPCPSRTRGCRRRRTRKPSGVLARLGSDEDAPVGQVSPSAADVVDEDRARPRPALDDVEHRFVGREGEAVRAVARRRRPPWLARCGRRRDRRWMRQLRLGPCRPRSSRGCRRAGR